MAYSTRKMAGASNTSNKLTQKALDNEIDVLKAQRQTVELMKNAHMPVLDLRVSLDRQNAKHEEFTLTLVNKGTGPAFVRDITVRDDVNLSSLAESHLRTAIVQPTEQVADQLSANSKNDLMRGNDSVTSSWSVWYEDIYGRWYRTRIVIDYLHIGSPDQQPRNKVLNSEFFTGVEPIVASFGSLSNLEPSTYVRGYELGKAILSRSTRSAKWYSLKAIQGIRGRQLPGSAITHGEPVTVLDVGFWLPEGDPVFTLRIADFQPFVLGAFSERKKHFVESQQWISVQVTRENTPPPTDVPHSKLAMYGLHASERADDEVRDLYSLVFSQTEELLEANV